MALARFSRSSFSSLRSKWEGGKKTAACGPRHAALACQRSSCIWALIAGDPPLADVDLSADLFVPTRGELSRAIPPDLLFCLVTRASLTGVAGAAGLRFDLEHEPVDRDDPDVSAGLDRRGPVRPRPPEGASDLDGALGSEIPQRVAQLAHHPLAADGGRREAGPDQRGNAGDHEDRHAGADEDEHDGGSPQPTVVEPDAA